MADGSGTTAAAAPRLVVFALAGEQYGVPITVVQEIIRYADPRPVPGSPSHVEGVINLRGRIVPIIDLRSRMGMGGARSEESTTVITDVDDPVVGVVVDEVREVLTVAGDRCEQPPEGAGEADYLEAVAKLEGRLVVILDMARLLGERVPAAAAA